MLKARPGATAGVGAGGTVNRSPSADRTQESDNEGASRYVGQEKGKYSPDNNPFNNQIPRRLLDERYERTEVESLHENEVQMDPGVQEPIKSSGPRHPATLNVLYDLIIVPKAAQMSTMATVFTTGLCL